MVYADIDGVIKSLAYAGPESKHDFSLVKCWHPHGDEAEVEHGGDTFQAALRPSQW